MVERMTSNYGPRKVVEDTGVPGVERYRIHVPTKYLELTTQKFDLARLPQDFEYEEGQEWSEGTPKKVIEDLIDYWQENYSWRREEAKLNELPQFKTSITPAEGHNPLRLHFVWKKSTRENAVPVLLLHGWPSSPYEFYKVVNPLAEPEDKDAQAFHVVVPSLPGYGFSDPPAKAGVGIKAFAKMFHELMTKLGYSRYFVHGSDWGGLVGRYLCVLYPNNISAYHSCFYPCPPPSIFKSPFRFLSLAMGMISKGKFGITPDEYSVINSLRHFAKFESGYSKIQGTKPLSLAYGMTDSPIGSLAWLREKMHAWTDNYEWTQDEVLTWWMLNWLPGPFASMRLYKQSGEGSAELNELIKATSTVPLGISTHLPVPAFPASWANPYQPLKFERVHKKGGHFVAFEVPEIFVKDLRDFFSPYVKTEHSKFFPPPSTESKGKTPVPIAETPIPATTSTTTSPPPTAPAPTGQLRPTPTTQSSGGTASQAPSGSGSQVPIIRTTPASPTSENGGASSPPVGVHELAGSAAPDGPAAEVKK